LVFWDEDDKYYIAECLEDANIVVYPQRAKHKFVISFLCEPFAYGEQKIQAITQGVNVIDYNGTQHAPTLIILRNPNDFDIQKIIIKAIVRRR